MSRYPRGSEWRKWDLHIHTPDSHLNQQFGGDWEKYLQALSDSECTVYGITNYFCFAERELEKVREAFQQKKLDKTVFGNLEFRINQPNKSGEFINVHVLFSDSLPTQSINDVLSRLKLVNTADPNGDQPIYCSVKDVMRAGLDFSKVMVSLSELANHLKQHFKRSEYLIGCCPSGYGSFRPAPSDGRGNQLAVEIDKLCDLAFGSTNDRDFFLKSDRYPGASKKPVVAGSDAHNYGELNRRFCWIKANPTFEGLRQVLFEPEDRIALRDENPDLVYPKPFFSRVEAHGEIIPGEPIKFEASKLELNSGLVAIVGGRGDGKSILLDCLYKQFCDPPTITADNRVLQISPESFAVTLKKQGGSEEMVFSVPAEGAIGYLHVRQGDIRKLAENPDSLSGEIKRLLGISSGDSLGQTGLEMEALLGQIAEAKRWFEREDNQGNKTNTKVFNERSIRINEERIKAITSKENRELVNRFNQNTEFIARTNKALQKLRGLKTKLEQLSGDTNSDISSINSILDPRHSKIPLLEVSAQIASVKTIEESLAAENAQRTAQNSDIHRQFKDQGIEQDPAGLLDKVAVSQRVIVEAKQRIDEIDARSRNLTHLLQRRGEIATVITNTLLEEKGQIEAAFALLKQGKKDWDEKQSRLVQRLLADVTVSGEVVFQSDEFYSGLVRFLDGRKFRQLASTSSTERMAAKFSVRTFDDFVRLIGNQQIIVAEDGSKIDLEKFLALRDHHVPSDERSLLEYLYLPQHQQSYLRVLATLKYKGKDPTKLSVGQRGTFYICIKLATDPFGSPFVFDQPEDDLDNDFIVRELVPLFKEIKQYRQIVVATHNANLVVNSDAEQIIIARNTDENLSYVIGALEEPRIRDAVCTVLEGGADAFQKRESKYSFST
jgi:hypothetical protein